MFLEIKIAMWFDSQSQSEYRSFEVCHVFCIHYGTIVWDNTVTTPNTLYMKTVNKKNARRMHTTMYAILHTHRVV